MKCNDVQTISIAIPSWFAALVIAAISFTAYQFLYVPLVLSPLNRIPGPKSFAITRWRLMYEDWKGTRTTKIHKLHLQYGSAVRVSPNEVSFNSLAALRTIYGAGSRFERTEFYRMFDVYGRQNLFTFSSSTKHAARKKLLTNAYSKSRILKHPTATAVQDKTRQYLQLLELEPDTASEIFTSLHYFSFDAITNFLYGNDYGGTSALTGSVADRALLQDMVDPARSVLSWWAVHFPRYTKWLYTRTGLMDRVLTRAGVLPMRKPTVYSGIRAHALDAWVRFKDAAIKESNTSAQDSILGMLWKHHESQKEDGLEDMDIASECADQLLAGIDTTSHTLMFLIWALSLPENRAYQEKLISEVSMIDASLLDRNGIPSVQATDTLPYLGALLKETLRLYVTLPASEPRSLPVDSVIDGYHIPARVIVGISPYCLHQNAQVFHEPLRFNPERWFGPASDVEEMKRWFWAFSSGGRMCIGLHLAMAEMTTLMAAVYRNYSTTIKPGYEGVSPGVTSRFEVFFDETFKQIETHACWIDFHKR
ncbi:MAG: benzoate 4-monooxygenase cytochrome P450 [Lasallia pustulata]|uniref:Benzoate 4-monooxygenase cytochrome P450 n=1 Tax=Lasallia pustulata TaxID=136370 RepID=A0A5M8PRA0_9LECA|nr:MAG: benzoate 4-monooxygenase cytochrome P450 [Lasallia pustulata]